MNIKKLNESLQKLVETNYTNRDRLLGYVDHIRQLSFRLSTEHNLEEVTEYQQIRYYLDLITHDLETNIPLDDNADLYN